MHSKLAGLNLPLADMIANVIDQSRSKIAAVEEKEKDEKKSFPKKEEKKESKKDEKEEGEKTSAVIDYQDPEEVEKLASALDVMAELVKEAGDLNGQESKQGGTQLPVMPMVGGKQTYTGNKAKTQIPAPTTKSTNDNPGAANALATDEGRAPGGTGAKYPAKGVLKTAAENILAQINAEKEKEAFSTTREGHKLDAAEYASLAKAHHEVGRDVSKAREEYHKKAPIRSFLLHGRTGSGQDEDDIGTRGLRQNARHFDYAAKKHEKGQNAYNPFGGLLTPSRHESKEKKSEAVDFILSKIAEVNNGGEKKQGGEQLSNTAPVPSNPGRQLISSNSAPAGATKRDAKSPRKAELAQVLNEPAMTSSTDNTVQQNLRNASKGGVKIAAVKAELQKIASDPSDPRHEALMASVKAKQASKSTTSK
jgi:hypothetical protein